MLRTPVGQQPEPGDRLPAPDPSLRQLQRFVNTRDVEQDADQLGTPAIAADWLYGEGLRASLEPLTSVEHQRLVSIRETLRALGAANNGHALEVGEREEVSTSLSRVRLRARLAEDGEVALDSLDGDVDRFIARLIGILIETMANGSWSRLKACRMHSCRWLFWDASRNRSGTWCTMAICGTRQKSRAYRARQGKR